MYHYKGYGYKNNKSAILVIVSLSILAIAIISANLISSYGYKRNLLETKEVSKVTAPITNRYYRREHHISHVGEHTRTKIRYRFYVTYIDPDGGQTDIEVCKSDYNKANDIVIIKYKERFEIIPLRPNKYHGSKQLGEQWSGILTSVKPI